MIDAVKVLLADILQLGDRAAALTAEARLFGALPELDSMAVADLVAGLEQRFAISIDDDDLTIDAFRTVGSLAALVERKLQG